VTFKDYDDILTGIVMTRIQFSIAEISGRLLSTLTLEERSLLREDHEITCPFDNKTCKKRDHVCSIQRYREPDDIFLSESSPLVAICPRRLRQDNKVYNAIASLFGNERFVCHPEFAMSYSHKKNRLAKSELCKLDFLFASLSLVVAVEVQTVYFSGDSMASDIALIAESREPFLKPVGNRHPDFKSSGQKRLWPQIECEWNLLRQSDLNSKLAIVMDSTFFNTLPFDPENIDLRNAEIVWVVVNLIEHDHKVELMTEVKGSTFAATKELFTDHRLDSRKLAASIDMLLGHDAIWSVE
jgi:hypothetical protein